MDIRFAIFPFGVVLCVSVAFAQSPETKQKSPTETEVILQDSEERSGDPKRNYRVHEPMGSANPDDER